MTRRGLATAAILAVLAAGTAWTAHTLHGLDAMFVNENAWRDVPTYRDIALGMLPVQGPTTSIGGHHGFLGTWPWGAALALSPTPDALWAAGAALYALTGALLYAVARQVASAPAAALGVGILGSTNLFLMPQFPSHIMFLPAGAALALLGTLRAPRHAGWVAVAVAGVLLSIGSHRSGWILLPLVLGLDRAGARALLRGPRAALWVPVAVYAAIVGWIATWPGPPGVTVHRGSLLGEVLSMNPAQLLLQMPFFHFGFAWLPPLQLPQLATVAAAWWVAWQASPRPDTAPLDVRRTVLAFYGVWFAGLTFYKYDTHYLMPMLAALPAVLAMGLDAAWSRGPRAGWAALAWLGVLHGASAATVQGFAVAFVDAPGSALHRLTDRLAIVRALDALEVTEEEAYTAAAFVDRPDGQRLAWIHRAFSSRVGTVGTRDRCLRIVRADRPPDPEADATADAGRFRVDVVARGAEPCPADLVPAGPVLWWWRAADGAFLQRQTGAWQQADGPT